MMRSAISRRVAESSVYSMYRDHGREHSRYVALAIAFGAVGTALTQVPQVAFGLVIELLDPTVTQSQFPFADRLFSANPQDRILEVSALLFGSVFAVAAFRFASRYLWNVFKQLFQKSIRVDCYASVQGLHPKRFIQRSSGEYLSIVESDVEEVGDLPRTVLSGVSNDVVNLATIGVVLFTLNWQFSLLILAPLPFIAWFTFRFSAAVEPLYTEVRESSARLTSQLSSSIRGVLTVRSYVAEDRETDRVDGSSEQYKSDRLELAKTRLSYGQIFSLTSRLTGFVVVCIGSLWVVNGPPLFFTEPLSAGELAVFFTNSTLLVQPATSVRRYVDKYKDAKASSDRVYAILEAEERDRRTSETALGRVDGTIEFDDVVFEYGFSDADPLAEVGSDDGDAGTETAEPFVLGPVSCEIEAGQTVGVVGPSGSGKTTFVRLLLRFLDPDDGRILVDGRDISDTDPKTLRRRTGYVAQQPYIFDATVAENILYGNPSANERELERAVTDAVLADTIERMAAGLETRLGESESRVSGGEEQRIAIARAVVSDPSILILDEATSHVDNITESRIQASIESATADRTTIAIAHRLSTVRRADKILVFDDGRIVERGTHEDLLERNGLYQELWSRHVGLA